MTRRIEQVGQVQPYRASHLTGIPIPPDPRLSPPNKLIGRFEPKDLVYRYNKLALPPSELPIRLVDETLRDGLQSRNVTIPTLDQAIELLHLMNDLRFAAANIGMPTRGTPSFDYTLALAREMATSKLKIQAYSLAGVKEKGAIDAIHEVSQKAGLPIMIELVLGSSPIRQASARLYENDLLNLTREFVQHILHFPGLSVVLFAEDAFRARPETLEKIFLRGIDNGVTRIGIADTSGSAPPHEVHLRVKHALEVIKKSGAQVDLDAHFHDDRGFGLINALEAILAGADGIHGCALGIGERTGNTDIGLLLINLVLEGLLQQNLSLLPRYVNAVSEACRVPIRSNYQVFGPDSRTTGAGFHAAMTANATQEGGAWLADQLYCGVPPNLVGLKQIIAVGPMSGKSNIKSWLQTNQPWLVSQEISITDDLINHLWHLARSSRNPLRDDEIKDAILKYSLQSKAIIDPELALLGQTLKQKLELALTNHEKPDLASLLYADHDLATLFAAIGKDLPKRGNVKKVKEIPVGEKVWEHFTQKHYNTNARAIRDANLGNYSWLRSGEWYQEWPFHSFPFAQVKYDQARMEVVVDPQRAIKTQRFVFTKQNGTIVGNSNRFLDSKGNILITARGNVGINADVWRHEQYFYLRGRDNSLLYGQFSGYSHRLEPQLLHLFCVNNEGENYLPEAFSEVA